MDKKEAQIMNKVLYEDLKNLDGFNEDEYDTYVVLIKKNQEYKVGDGQVQV